MNEKKMLISGIVVIVFGLIAVLFGTMNYNEYNKAIENNEVTQITAYVTDTTSRRVSSSSSSSKYKYTDTYEYTVDGQTYTGTETETRESIFRNDPSIYEVYYYNDDPRSNFLVSDTKTSSLLFLWALPIGGLGLVVYSELKRRMIIL